MRDHQIVRVVGLALLVTATSLGARVAPGASPVERSTAVAPYAARPAPPPPSPPGLSVLLLAADWDDDDGDQLPDAEQAELSHATDLLPLAFVRPRVASSTVDIAEGAPVRLLVHGRPVGAPPTRPDAGPRPSRPVATSASASRPAPAVALQATSPGHGTVRAAGREFEVRALGLLAFDAAGTRVDLAREHASFVRRAALRREETVAPASGAVAEQADPDEELRFVVAGMASDLPPSLRVESWAGDGARIGEIEALTLLPTPCPAGVGAPLRCASTRPLRVVATPADAGHASREQPAIVAELGGSLSLRAGDLKLGVIRVGGPRATVAGPISGLRVSLRVTLVRSAPGGAPPVGDDDQNARAVMRASVAHASALWASCGVSFGPPDALAVRFVDPPPAHLLAVGCGLGLPASGGELRLRADSKTVAVTIPAGAQPREAARRIAVAFERAGFVVRTADTPAVGPAASGGTDLSIRTSDGRFVTLSSPATGAISSDATLGVCIGTVDLADGLEHFGDVDAVAGTLEERTLLRAIVDGDPTTLDVVIVPGLARGDRIGESFIAGPRGSPRNTVILDRAGLRPGRAGLTLAHEVGHLLLADPGHPDDFGIDTPTQLMDADSDDVSEHGATRLGLAECAQALVQSGPAAPAPLLRAWPRELARFRGAPWLGGLPAAR